MLEGVRGAVRGPERDGSGIMLKDGIAPAAKAPPRAPWPVCPPQLLACGPEVGTLPPHSPPCGKSPHTGAVRAVGRHTRLPFAG